jgi:hypothetical protein
MGIIKEEYFKIINKLINKICPNIRKPKYNTKYYLKRILYVLGDVVCWKSLRILYTPNNKKYHYKTIEGKFLQWSRLNIFKKAFNELLNTYTLKDIKSSTTLNLFIDTSDIVNKNGSELVNYGLNKKKKICKLSAICDSNKNVYGITAHLGSMHDTKTVKKSIY